MVRTLLLGIWYSNCSPANNTRSSFFFATLHFSIGNYIRNGKISFEIRVDIIFRSLFDVRVNWTLSEVTVVGW